MKIKYLVFALLFIGFGSLVYYRVSKNKEVSAAGGRGSGGPGGKGGGMPMRVQGVVLQPQAFDNTLSVSGSIQANEQVEIKSQLSGLVRNIAFQEGSSVKKGQLLVKIDDTELRAQLSQAQTRQNLAAENEKRASQLLQKEAISREEYDLARAEFKSTQAQTQLVQAQLAKTSIVAPFSGRIGLRTISEGEYLVPTTVVANLVNTDPVKLTFSVPEKYANQVKTGTQLLFTVAGSSKQYTAMVYAIEPGIETTTRTLELRAKAANPEGTLLPGSFANIQLPLTTIPDALLVPTQAIIPVQNGKKVFVSEMGKAKEVMVEASTRTAKDLLITSGLKAGDTVLTTGIMTLKADAPVKVRIVQK